MRATPLMPPRTAPSDQEPSMPASQSLVPGDPSSSASPRASATAEGGTAVVPVPPAVPGGGSLTRVALAEKAARAAHGGEARQAGAPLVQPLARAQKLHWLLQQVAWRGAGVQVAAAATLPWHAGDVATWQEWWALQNAVATRLQAQQQAWVDGCTALWGDYTQLGRANTVAKAMDQEYGIAARFGALVKDQMADFAELVENAQVNWAYWLSRKNSVHGARD
jgi:hypothetical protein